MSDTEITVVDDEELAVSHGETESITLEWKTTDADGGAEHDLKARAINTEATSAVVYALSDRRIRGTTSPMAGSVSRAATYSRTTTGSTSTAGTTEWTAPKSFSVPAPAADDTRVLLTPSEADVDYSTITISTSFVPAAKTDRLEPYLESGDVELEPTAFGAFRRVSRDGSGPIELTPPADWEPPLSRRRVFPLSYSVDEQSPDRYAIELELGLEQPRGREAPESSRDGDVVATRGIDLEPGESISTTIRWDTTGDDEGFWQGTVSTTSPQGLESAETTTLSVTGSEFALNFPTETMNLSTEDIHPISRSTSNGIEHVTVGLNVGGDRAAVLFAVGSRIEAGNYRQVPDGPSRVVDTLPQNDLSVDLTVPEDHELDSGAYVLVDWSATRSDPVLKPWELELELARQG